MPRAYPHELVRAEVQRVLASITPDEYLTTAEAARVASVAPKTIRRWIRTGKLVAHSAGRELRIRRADLERAMRPTRGICAGTTASGSAGGGLACVMRLIARRAAPSTP